MVVKTPVDGVIAEDALKFSQEQGIVEYVEKAMRAARDVFRDAEPIMARLKRDPEYGDLFVEIHVLLREDEEPETAAEKDSSCYERWSFIPAEIGGKICLSSSWESR